MPSAVRGTSLVGPAPDEPGQAQPPEVVGHLAERVSLSSPCTEGNNDSIAPDQRRRPGGGVTSDADNLVTSDGNLELDLFVRDRQTRTTVRASVRSEGTETGFELGS